MEKLLEILNDIKIKLELAEKMIKESSHTHTQNFSANDGSTKPVEPRP